MLTEDGFVANRSKGNGSRLSHRLTQESAALFFLRGTKVLFVSPPRGRSLETAMFIAG